VASILPAILELPEKLKLPRSRVKIETRFRIPSAQFFLIIFTEFKNAI
jgi:hypothetical protein